jgi:DNA adenine methylase
LKTNKNFLRPFIRWAGGKQNLVRNLLENTPDDDKVNKYWEPFLGAGSLFLANGFRKAELSDINEHLINAYQQIKNNPKAVHNRLLFHKRNFNKKYYYRLRDLYNEHLTENTIEQASRFIFLVHTSYNGIYRVNQQGEYNVPIGKMEPSLPSLEHLRNVSKKLKNIMIKPRPYQDILPLVSEGDFIYLDPPYPPLDWDTQLQQFTSSKFTKQHQKQLAVFANQLSDNGCLVMISNSDIPLIRRLYKDWNIITLETTRWVSCKSMRKKVNELLIMNY